MPITLTFDLEDNRRSPDQPARFVDMSERFLEYAAQRGITATVFIVGEIGASHPELVRRVAQAGHEIGLHGLRHVAVPALRATDGEREQAVVDEAHAHGAQPITAAADTGLEKP